MKQLMTTDEAAMILGISKRSIERWAESGKLESQIINGSKGGGKAGQVLMVWIGDPKESSEFGVSPCPPCLVEAGCAGEAGRSSDSKLKSKSKPKDRYRVHRGEPGRKIATSFENGIPKIDSPSPFPSPPRGEGRMIETSSPQGEGVIGFEPPPSLQSVAAPTAVDPPSGGGSLPAVLDSGLRRNDNPRANRIANLRFAIIRAFNKEASKNHRPRAEIIKRFLDLFNSGVLLSEIRSEIKQISRSTLYNWVQLYDQSGVDGLIPQHRGGQDSPIAPAEKQFLLTKLLDQNKPTIGDSINKCKFLLGDTSPSSPSKLRRWINQFKKENHDIWTLEREGEKALNDKCVPYAEREWRDLSVGEAVVADGHKLNFQVVNPFTGKPIRAMMVMFWDWKSSYPLGWEIMLTESIQCVVAALRNAIITLGKFPKHALLDNGKAFRANIFRKEFRFQETEIPGIFDKLNISPHFAMPYNAQSKPIERFFRTFNDWFERELPSYIGASINDKPPHMSRNEKRAKELHNEWVPTIPEAMELIFQWREYYIDQPLRARDGQRPRDIFEAEKGPGVDPFALHFLMMTCKARMVHRNGITFNGWHWYHENLYGFKDYVLMFYSYYDLSQVYIFTTKNEFLCTAKPVEKLKPFAADSEFPEDMADVQQKNATKRKLIHTTKKLADLIQSQKDLYIDYDRTFRDRPEVAEAIKQIEDKKPKIEKLSPFPDEPETKDTETPGNGEAEKETGRPKFDHDFEKYDWLMEQAMFEPDDLKYIRDYRSSSSLYKHTVFDDDEELNRKVMLWEQANDGKR